MMREDRRADGWSALPNTRHALLHDCRTHIPSLLASTTNVLANAVSESTSQDRSHRVLAITCSGDKPH